MKYAFYITNHGFGHASRNVPIIKRLLERDEKGEVVIKSDKARCDFLRRNLVGLDDKIKYYSDCGETGLVLKENEMVPDLERMKQTIEQDFVKWPDYVARETEFLKENKPDIVVADVVCWAIKAAHNCGIKTLLIGNFSWAQMYKYFYEEPIWRPYLDYYNLADQSVWYEIHEKELEEYGKKSQCVSMVSRKVDYAEVDRIKAQYNKPIVFVSLGASAEIRESIFVGDLPYDFVITRGLDLTGDNVHELPLDMINTPDYIAAADYVIAKGGWSTVAEILLQGKKCALFFRGNNPEDDNTRKVLEGRRQCVSLFGHELSDMQGIIDNINSLNPTTYETYVDDTDKICDIMSVSELEQA